MSPNLYLLINKYFRRFLATILFCLATKAYFLHLCQFVSFLVILAITDFFHNSSYISYHFHMETLFLNYQYYKILFILIISRIIAFYIYNIISTNFIYAFLFFANKMQTMFTFIFLIIIKMPRWQRT